MKKLFTFCLAMATTLCVNAETINNYEYVDLGLPSGLLWATCNVGASAPEIYGNYYAWGEIATKTTYTWENYTLANGSSTTLTKYNNSSSYGTVDNKTTLEAADDVATQIWGGAWRMPTKDEWQELIDNCDWTWTTKNGVNGHEVKATNGNSIFLPAAGCCSNDVLYFAGSFGNYWSSSLNSDSPDNAQYVDFSSDNHGTNGSSRYCGLSVRPVIMVYGITIAAATNGSVEAAKEAYAGQEVALTIKPDAGYEIESISVKDADNKDVTVSEDNKFTMPAGAVTVSATFKKPDTKEYVDLGLPSGLLWATCNVGASAPEIYGNYYAWGEIATKITYDWTNYKYANGDYSILTKYCDDANSGKDGFTDELTTLETADDAATQIWGGNWRMPTIDEWQELRNNCTWTWTTLNGVKGHEVKATNGNSIFLPAAGYYIGTVLLSAGSYGYYWSSSLYTNNPSFAQRVYFGSSNHDADGYYRGYGQSVRPVIMVYGITIAATTNGSVEADKTAAAAGETITLTITPETGYEVESVIAINTDTKIPLAVSEDYKFTMPAANVSVSATFKATTTTALQNVEMAEIYAENGTIYGAEGMQIFTITGQNVTEMNGLLNGVYIVKIGNAAQKIVVR